MPLAEVCLDQDGKEDCKTINVPAQDAQQLGVKLAYTLASAAHLPGVNAEAGTPAACDITDPQTGAITKRVGAAVQATGASFKSGSSVSIFVTKGGQTEVVKVIQPGTSADTFGSLGASVCLVPLP
jgi:hypothetical protein